MLIVKLIYGIINHIKSKWIKSNWNRFKWNNPTMDKKQYKMVVWGKYWWWDICGWNRISS